MSKVLEEISEWKLEAKLEDSSRYFYNVSEAKYIENGKKSYVIGRKGTGKTAIAEHLNTTKAAKRFSIKLSFKNFPFNSLYDLENTQYRDPNQYITLWKYLIYSSIAKLMASNQGIDAEISRKLNEIYSTEPIRSLSRTISNWVSGSFNFSIGGHGMGVGTSKISEENKTPWIDRVDVLEELISKHIDDSKYFIVFDELDEDYKDVIEAEKHNQYTSLLTSLFKAVQDVKSIFPSNEFSIFPVIFLRDDIYDILLDPDKTKWNDMKINLDWNEDKIKDLLSFRISRAIDLNGETLSFKSAWNSIFTDRPVGVGNRQRKKIKAFDYITRSTFIRPRDYIKYIQSCAEMSLGKKNNIITSNVIVKVDIAFSNYLRSELEDEILGILPEIGRIIDMMSHLRKQTFKIEEFISGYNYATKRGEIPDRGADFVLRILFHFSIIGNQPKQSNVQVFRYLRKEARLNVKEKICIHRGFFKSMQIL